MNLFRAPAAARAAKALDRSLFSKTVPLAAASLRENKLISKYRKQLETTKEVLDLDRFDPIAADPDPALAAQGRKCLVLGPQIKAGAPETWSPILKQASEAGDLRVIPYDVHIGYEIWTYLDVMKSILPEDLHGEIPVGFNTAGHVAHLNIRGQYLPYKHIIAQVIADKNPIIKTVINKTDNVGTESEFRTFSYEVLHGPDDLAVEVSEAGCIFRFDYSKVYWNTKLGTEHQRITALCEPGEVLVDVMAGIGPFAVPAGKKGVFVWANDKNPESYRYLSDAVQRNKVGEFVRAFNDDGHDFIKKAADMVLEASRRGDHAKVPGPKPPRTAAGIRAPRPQPIRVPVPPTVSHFVMNLPASALEFLHNFRGLYEGHAGLFAPHTEARLPMVHVHCFAVKGDDAKAREEICERIYREIGVRLRPGEDAGREGEVVLHEVRDVAPAKRMFCASFRLPAEVAFAPRS
ncbi:tRNA (guanine(37)-N1)-methyltransferase [Escovopsis weberi]|uniref:tRNA (guanine(37)-N1)-methyltransferase n=1 Tax=Escovopsis weberi TaxID=150374 RepID=A0A0M9VWW3_ESCWE|nr:tRNA (guanine(37)-N1)-methyltransferase [Escovopsis weberi]